MARITRLRSRALGAGEIGITGARKNQKKKGKKKKRIRASSQPFLQLDWGIESRTEVIYRLADRVAEFFGKPRVALAAGVEVRLFAPVERLE